MAYGEDDGAGGAGGAPRQRDDETQAYLIEFFREAATQPSFAELFNALTPAEQEKLKSMSA